jgi:hypothetical protein
MNIRKIIREEIDSDWGFMDDLDDFNISNTIIHFDPPLRNSEYTAYLVPKLKEMGVRRWENRMWLENLVPPSMDYLLVDVANQLSHENYDTEDVNYLTNFGFKVVDGRDLFGIPK